MKNPNRLQGKFLFVLLCFMFFTNMANAQYILGGDFENVTAYTKVINGHPNTSLWNASTMFPSPWLQPTDGTCDVLNDFTVNGVGACYDPFWNFSNGCFSQVCTTDNKFGGENPRAHATGSNYVFMGFTAAGTNVSYSPADFREYLQVPINRTGGLVKGQCYELDFWVSLSDYSQKCTPIQAYISPTAPTHHGNFAGPLPTNMAGSQLLESKCIDYKTGWYHIYLHFTAYGGEEYVTIGFFEDQSSPKIKTSTSAPNYNATSCGGPITDGAYYYIDDVNLSAEAASFAPTASYSNTTVSGTWGSSDRILLNGTITLSGTLILNGTNVKCTSGTKIIVPSGKTLSINGSTLMAGCDHMWDGIVVQTGGVIYMDQYSNTLSDIEDALTAVDLNGGLYYIRNSTFKRNMVDIQFDYVNITPGHYIKTVTFDHTQQLKDPTLTATGKGLSGITVTALSGISGALLVGGATSTDGCQFLDGDYGIQSSEGDVTVQYSTFTNIQKVGIDFQGNNPTTLKTLAVTNCQFDNNYRQIFSQHHTNLTVQKNVFKRSHEHAIQWQDNHDGHLLIGDATTSANGNTFTNNSWACIVAWDNKSTQTDPYLLASNNSGLSSYTSIIIAYNTINAPSFPTEGIQIGEWALGGNVTYRLFDISHNTMYGIVKGLQMYNVKGWGGIFPSNNTPSSLPVQQVFANMIYTSTVATPVPFGMKVENSPGYRVSENGVSSDNLGNYQNTGIIFQDSPNTEVYGNIMNAGTFMKLIYNMNGSNVHCNWSAAYAVGFSLNSCVLRPNSSTLHGSAGEEFNNAFPYSTIPWNTDMELYSSDVANNKWVWNGASSNLTTAYHGSCGVGSVYSTVTGADQCPGPYGRIYPPGDTNIFITFSSNANMQWRTDYDYESQRLNTGKGDSTFVSSNIKKIIHTADLIGAQDYGQAKTILSSLSPSNGFEQNYKEVLSIFINLNVPDVREARTGEVDTLVAIAEQSADTAGPAITLARAFLAVKYHKYFNDPAPHGYTVVTGTAYINSPCSLSPVPKTELRFMDHEGNDVGITGTTIDADGNFTVDPYALHYYSRLNPDTTYRIYSTQGSQFTVMNYDFHTLDEWMTASPISLSLAGVSLAMDTLTASPYRSIDTCTSITDKEGNVYMIGVIMGGTTKNDFLIEKRTSSSTLMWSRTWNGPGSDDDSATCMTTDNDFNIYVAGKVYNGESYDVQILKYDKDGTFIWASTLADSLKKENTPTGISVDVDGSVNVVSTSKDKSGTSYRYDHFIQCLPSTSGLAREGSKQITVPTSAIEFYPNPSDGNITVVLNNKTTTGVLDFFNLEGQLVFSWQVTQSGKIDLPANQVPNGVYLLRFTGEDDIQFNKLIIQRNN